MSYTNSSLISYTGLSPNHSGQRTHVIDRITPHCVVGQLSAESICGCFPAGRDASCNYGIGYDGRISLCVEEKNRSWCSSSSANDQRAVTIECASDKAHPYAMTDAVYKSLVNLCTDICRRNGKKKLIWFADKNKSLNYAPKSDEMIITVHRWFANKSCPGDWLYNRLGDLAAKVTARLGGESKPNDDGSLYHVQVGAYSKKENADAMLAKIKTKGFDAFISTKGGSAVTDVPVKKSIDIIAKEVIEGKWGNGNDRINRLTSAGYDANAVQAKVNALLGGSSKPSKSIDTIAREVIRGDWGNGNDRKARLEKAGYNYAAVQKRVNELL